MIVKNNLLNFKGNYIYQDTDFFKMSLDSVLLANFVNINLRDKKILDIATGNAPIPMLLSFRTKAKIYGVELQKPIYKLGMMSVIENKKDDQIILLNEDARNLKKIFQSDYFDVIVCNPPYFKVGEKSYVNDNEIKAIARHEYNLNIDDLLNISRYLLRNQGRISIVHRADRLIDIIMMMKKYNIEPKRIRFVYPKKGKKCDLILIEGSKNGKSGFKVEEPLYIYDEEGNYSKEVSDMYGGI